MTSELDVADWVELEWVFGPDGYVQEVAATQSEQYRVFSTGDETMLLFQAKDARIAHAVCRSGGAWVCGCGAKPCLATALLQLRDAVQPFLTGRR